jgi:hypothetical protein
MKKLLLLVALLASPAAAQTLPQPNVNGNAPTVVCGTLQTATKITLGGVPIQSPPPSCVNVQDADLPNFYAPFAASCVPTPPEPACTPLEVAAAISTYIHNRLLDRIADFQRQQVTQAAIQALPAVNLTPAQ